MLLAALVFFGFLSGAANAQQFSVTDEEIRTEQAFQRRLVAEDKVARQKRLDEIIFRVMRGAVKRCGNRTKPFHGLSVATRYSFNTQLRAPAQEAFGLDDRLQVLFVTPGSPADLAGFDNSDVIARTDGRDLTPGPAAVRQWELLVGRAGRNPIRLVAGGTRPRVAIVRPVDICDYPVDIRESRTPNAFTSGNKIAITKSVMDFSNDAELAFIVSHELAHNLLGHVVRSKKAEIEADYTGLQILDEAGYPIDEIAEFWRRMAVAFPTWIADGVTHPTTTRRFLVLKRAAAILQAKRGTGQPASGQTPAAYSLVPGVGGSLGLSYESFLTPAEITEIEELLAHLKFDPGRIDGVIDGGTRVATRRYQEFAGLPVDGMPTEAILVDLRAVAALIGGGG